MKTFEDIMYCKFTPELKHLTILNFCCNDEAPLGSRGTSPPQLNTCDAKEILNSPKGCTTTKITSLHVGFACEEKGRLPVGWTDFLEHYPVLKNFGILIWDHNEDWDILDAISQLRGTDKTKLQLTELHIGFPKKLFASPERLLAFYQQVQLPLEKLEIRACENNTTEFVSDLVNLHLHSSSLKELTIFLLNFSALWDQGWSPPFEVEGLQELHIYGRPVFRNLGFLIKFPNLESLVVQMWRPEEIGDCKLISSTTYEDMDGVVAASLTQFDYKYEEICGAEEIRKIQRWMPNLKWLNIAVTEDGLAAVQLLLPQLETINLRRHDDVMVG